MLNYTLRLRRVAQTIWLPCRYASEAFTRRFEGKIAVLTASTQGIGLDTARRFALEGAKVLICSRKQKNVDEAVRTLANEGLDVKGVVCHVGKQEERDHLLNEAAKLGGIDILFANAAVNPVPGPIVECTEGVWDKIFDVNLKSTFFLAKESLPLMRQRQGGSIILTSTCGVYASMPNIGIYRVSKTALLGLMKTMADELAEYNIRVNCVSPGYIDTKFVQILMDDKPKVLSTIPLRRVGRPKDISGVVAFLASDDADYITGENIIVAGGVTSRL
ncbi:dehydrogenase/reductase SDR family member 4-like [Photinus pyralis]|uniref:dehydrogenase/reductase SDR family member 4-like n=1 Tax=Photinus pyralis TaxID=7054 RepID=UPI001267123C|nr:dehydrogenase/reductase SDR family member 4-like [Photinus pyralis]